MSASPAPANADFTERLQRIRESQSAGMAGQSERHVPTRGQELAQNFRYAASGLAVVAAGVVGLIVYSVTYVPPDATCAPAPASTSPAMLKLESHKSSGRKAVKPEAADTATDCAS